MDSVEALTGASLHVVVIAASAGGLKAIAEVLSGLPAGFPAAVVVVQHLDPSHQSLMAEILTRKTGLGVKQARTGDALVPGSVFVAPPDRHLLVSADGTLLLSESKLVHFVRPSADLLFDSAASSFGGRCIAVVLTGTGVDGSEGVRAVKKAGGTVIAQDEVTAEFFGMPGAAIATGCADETLPLHEIAPALVRLVPAGGTR
jgi:two-component system chemotaxis response regulator CheB